MTSNFFLRSFSNQKQFKTTSVSVPCSPGVGRRGGRRREWRERKDGGRGVGGEEGRGAAVFVALNALMLLFASAFAAFAAAFAALLLLLQLLLVLLLLLCCCLWQGSLLSLSGIFAILLIFLSTPDCPKSDKKLFILFFLAFMRQA